MPSDETHGPPGRNASYGANLKYWMDILGVRGRDLAEVVNVHPSYPGKIQRGAKLPALETAGSIREQLLKKGREPGADGRPRLTEPELREMDDLLRTCFTREDDARRGARPADAVGAVVSTNDSITMASVAPPAHRRGRLRPLATIGLIALALVLTFGGVVYYATHATPPRKVNTPGQTYTPQQLRHAVITSQPPVYDALTAPDAYGWDEGPMPGGACHYQSGGYHATVVGTAVVQCLPETAPALPSAGTVGVQVDLTFLQGDGGAGLVLCYAGLKAPYYRFDVNPDGHFDLFDPVTGRPPLATALPLPPDAQYRLTAIVRATGVYLYINGVFMVRGDVERGVSFAGQVGVFAVNGVHNPTDVVFHNFTVWELPALT